ncbi:hypothetical protein P43SY_007066 [Pythium insidiosum]|uniref:Inositol polyphosphate-related phosphatase domain-containing protein n=1 Tax=Pythium insidiosum TaxID=114742 RepID=A0AAD5LQQ9_PYTIN|nr:hypothetical protein P43SY_007066 [Pythium insidiosum]
MPSDEHEQTLKGIAAGTSSGLSILGSLYILGRYWYARHMKAHASPVSTVHHVDVTKELVHVLAWLDLVGAAGRIFGVLPTETFKQSAGERPTAVCKLQATVIMFGDVAPIAWNFVMALNLFRWVCLGEDQQLLQRHIKGYILLTLCFALLVATLGLAFDVYGDAGLWCWVVVPGDRRRETYWKLGTLYIWVLVGALAMGLLLVLVKMDVQERLRGVVNRDARLAYQGVVHNLTVYILAFIVCWSPAVVDRGYSAIKNGEDLFLLSMLHASIVPLQGFVNAVIYGKIHVWIGRHLHGSAAHGAHGGASSSVSKATASDEALRADEARELEAQGRQLGTATLFVTSFDMNWSPFPPNLNDWIPAGSDLYVFSLQHCVNVQLVEQCIRRHLLQINYPMGYRSITSLAGAQFRGPTQDATVCQIVFINNTDIASGNFQFHAADGRMWAQRKAHKDVVGIPLRYFEASLAFVSCNLTPSSPHPNQQASVPDVPLSAKHAATSALIHSFAMDADRADVDFPLLYHHTLLAGNLNYNLSRPRPELATAMDQAFKAECLRRATDVAVDAKLRNFITAQGELGRRRSGAEDSAGAGAGAGAAAPHALAASGPGARLEPASSNVPVEWNLLYLKDRLSLGRASHSSCSSNESDAAYDEVYSATHDGVPFTLLRSPPPRQSSGSDSRRSSQCSGSECCRSSCSSSSRFDGTDDDSDELRVSEQLRNVIEIQIPETHALPSDDEGSGSPARTWRRFLEELFPTRPALQRAQTTLRPALKPGRGNSTRGESKKISDWLTKSQIAATSAQRKWQELIRHDELRIAMDAKEVLCGFEEPAISFLPSYPRRPGASASYSLLQEKSCKAAFADDGDAPSYKDRILSHSLPDTRSRLRNTRYWLCEEILTSTHKPVCSTYELEVDRFFAFKTSEADLSDLRAGKFTLKEKTDIQEFKIKLVNLDANIWTYQPLQRVGSGGINALWRIRSHAAPDASSNSVSDRASVRSGQSADSTGDAEPTARPKPSAGNGNGGMGGLFGGSRKARRIARSQSSRSLGGHSTTSGTGSTASARRGRLDSLDSSAAVELVPVEPSSISTVFPLPSEDVYALQRKVYEVAHSVQSGFQSSARDEAAEEALLAYTNFRTVSWKEATAHGVMHSAITKAVNGVVHVAVKIAGDRGQGGQGILCIHERDLIAHAAPVIGEAEPIPFDVPLTWGGKHVGYLHGDILSGL